MDWTFHVNIRRHLSPPPPPPPIAPIVSFQSRISPSVLLIIVILAIIFFISGLLHLLVRYLLRPIAREPAEDIDTVTAHQGQLQQLFHLHDAGVDQSFIDTLPVFLYKAIIGLKDPFDCAVCLCEFEADDKLRLLPKCSHAFHLECIDTWLLSHSTCPLCRRSLLPDFSPPSVCSPALLVLESGSEIASDRRDSLPNYASASSLGDDECSEKVTEISPKEEEEDDDDDDDDKGGGMPVAAPEASETKVVVPVRLGKFRSGAVGEGTASCSSNLDRRRCFSMGSYEYVMDESSVLQVPIKPPKKPAAKKPSHRAAMSECDFHSTREGFRGLEERNSNASVSSNLHLKESFSASKIWLQSKKDKPAVADSSRRAISFRFPLHRSTSDESKQKSSAATTSEFINVSTWEKKSCSEVDLDVEAGSSNQIDETPSFARRTLLRLVGRQSKVSNLESAEKSSR